MKTKISISAVVTFVFACAVAVLLNSCDSPSPSNQSPNYFTSLKEAFKHPERVHILSLSGQGLAELPPEIKVLKNMYQLHLTDNRLRTFPSEIGELSKLGFLAAGDNIIDSLPPALAKCPIFWLDLRNNRLRHLPEELGQIKTLEWVNLENNQLSSIPATVTDMPKLHTLKLKGNPITNDELEKIKKQLPGTKIEF
ncbi:MAG: leucine-rich repeat domain-containing protein [Chlorobi bacterium]|nr:leucine-rich repeat domain-containing protein [Chlorobiota bacterium]